MKTIYRITYQRPWGKCVVNTAQYSTEAQLRAGFEQSYPGCEILSIKDVTKEYLPDS